MEKLVDYLTRELHLEQSQREVIQYGLHSLIFTGISVITSLVLAFFLGILPETAIVLAAVMIYRKVSGGAHVQSAHGCLFIGTLAVLLLAKLASVIPASLSTNLVFIVLPSLIAIAIAYLRVPADVPQKPITSPVQIKTLRRLSFILLTCWLLLGIATLSSRQFTYYYTAGNLGLLWQSLLLTPPGYHMIAAVDPFFRPK